MKIIRWNPHSLLDDEFFTNPFSFSKQLGVDLAVDVYEKDENIVAEMHVPGINPDKFDISIEEHLLRVTGEREEKKELADKDYYSKEIKRGSFERLIELPALVDSSKTKAEYKDGILKIFMPKKTPSPQEKVKINVEK
jgi:HSP20 family protein